jgi:hypothetical protein
MTILSVERTGGFGGFGGPGSHLRSRGQIRLDQLSKADQAVIETLFKTGGKPVKGTPPVADGFNYIISRPGAPTTETITVPEAQVPAAVIACVKDELI